MLNKRPIFIVGFQRGGTAILQNLLLSHPEVCVVEGELHQVFRGRNGKEQPDPWGKRIRKYLNYLPIFLAQREDVFSIHLWQERRSLSFHTQNRIDKTLYQAKVSATAPTQNLFKAPDVLYSRQEREESRLLCKNLNGLIFMTDELLRMYPDAVFIALVRNGFALCEGHIRRGRLPKEVAQMYQFGCEKMIADAEKIPNYHIFRYEDLMTQSIDTLAKIYQCAGLDMNQVDSIRLVTTKVINDAGQHTFVHGTDEETLVWYKNNEFNQFFQTDVNEHQIAKLSETQYKIVQEEAFGVLNYFSYL